MKTSKLILCIFLVVIFVLAMVACEHTHEYGEWSVIKAATCTEKGIEQRVCECGEKETRDIDALGHSFGDWEVVTPANCTDKGSEKRVCACGEEETRDIDALGHSFSEWEVVTPANCTDKGTEKRVCACGEEETRDIDALGHTFSEWEVVTPSNCTDKGTEKRVCSCGEEETRDIEIVANAHDFGDWVVVSDPSATEEGELSRSCNHNASHVETKKILKTPVMSYSFGVIGWTSVDNATAYDLYKDNELLISLGNVSNLYTATAEGEYYVVARTSNNSYRESSEQSNTVTVAYYDNGLAGGNVENITNINSSWRFSVANFSGKAVSFAGKDGKTAVKLSPNAAVTIAVGGATVNRGMTIAVEFDVKVEGAEGGKMNIGLYYAPSWQLPLTDVAIPAVGEDGWAHICYEYTYGDDVAENAGWGNFDIRYVCEEGDGNCAYIADFRISKVEDGVYTKIDTANFGVTKLNAASDTWYFEFLKYGGYSENEFVFDGDNCMLKVTDSDSADASFIVASGAAFSVAGTYRLTMKVKLGPDAVSANIGNIGFEVQSDGTPNGVFVEFLRGSNGTWNFSQDEWTTIEAYVTITEKNCNWINLRFYLFTNNNVTPSEDNYILIDDITVSLQHAVTESGNLVDVDVLFIGASHFDFWRDSRGGDTGGSYEEDTAGIDCENLGIAGTRFDQWIVYMDVLLNIYNPKKIVVQLAGNDINYANKTVEQTFADMKTLTDNIHKALPDTQIYVCTYVPNALFPDIVKNEGKAYSAKLREYAEEVSYITVVDIEAAFIDPDTGLVKEGYNSSDKLHLSNDLGYPAFWGAIKEALGY